jgi:hypothetical protein
VPVLPAAHLVHFYATPEGLAQSLVGFFAEPLRRGESVVVVARHEHRRALDAALKAAGVDLAAELRSGRYLSLDVEETLASFLDDGRPTQELFDLRAKPLVVDAKRRTGQVHMYGEMISTLVGRGDIVAAMQLEDMWGAFLRHTPFPLVCGYPREVLEGDLAGVVDGVASVHDAFVTARATARRTPGALVDLPPGSSASTTARAHVRDVLKAWGTTDADLLDDAAVVVSELVGTAVRQGARRVTLSLAFEAGDVVVSLLDSEDTGLVAAEEDLSDLGRSVAVLGAMAAGWGVERGPEGTRVWARLRRS